MRERQIPSASVPTGSLGLHDLNGMYDHIPRTASRRRYTRRTTYGGSHHPCLYEFMSLKGLDDRSCAPSVLS